MKMKYKVLLVILVFVSVAAISVFYFNNKSSERDLSGVSENDNTVIETETETESISEITEPLKIEVLEFRKNELVFNFSADNLIDCFNAIYKADNKEPFLSHIEGWSSDTVSRTAHSEFETFYYQTKRDNNNYNDSIISFYVPGNSDYLQYVNLVFPEHSYTEYGYNNFKENCRYFIKTFFPDFDNECIEKFYRELYDYGSAESSYFSNGEIPYPKQLYVKDNIGLYSYCKGGTVCITIIPVNKEYTQKQFSSGTKVIYIDEII